MKYCQIMMFVLGMNRNVWCWIYWNTWTQQKLGDSCDHHHCLCNIYDVVNATCPMILSTNIGFNLTKPTNPGLNGVHCQDGTNTTFKTTRTKWQEEAV